MVAESYSLTYDGRMSHPVRIHTFVGRGFPSFKIAGLSSSATRAVCLRVRTALLNSGFSFPQSKVVVNVSPNISGYVTHLDTAIACSILAASKKIPAEKVKNTIFVGELSLDGAILEGNNTFTLLYGLREENRDVFVPAAQEQAAAYSQYPKVVIGSTLSAVVSSIIDEDKKYVKTTKIPISKTFPDSTFDSIVGCESAKRGLVISVAGWHPLLIDGSPGQGKTLLSHSASSLMPDLSQREAKEVIGFLQGDFESKRGVSRAFVEPHPSISRAKLIGGGNPICGGLISKAHKGILFLDEFSEYSSEVIESLRKPIEDRFVRLSRGGSIFVFPCDALFIAARNPCLCGFYSHPVKQCTCSLKDIHRYQQKISGSMLDRFDVRVFIEPEVERSPSYNGISLATAQSLISIAWEIQNRRYQYEDISMNAHMTMSHIKRLCKVTSTGERLLRQLEQSLDVSMRGIASILRVARTIADMNEHFSISDSDLLEAIQFRTSTYNQT